MRSFAGRWRRRGIDVDVAALAADPTIEAWSLLVCAGEDDEAIPGCRRHRGADKRTQRRLCACPADDGRRPGLVVGAHSRTAGPTEVAVFNPEILSRNSIRRWQWFDRSHPGLAGHHGRDSRRHLRDPNRFGSADVLSRRDGEPGRLDQVAELYLEVLRTEAGNVMAAIAETEAVQ